MDDINDLCTRYACRVRGQNTFRAASMTHLPDIHHLLRLFLYISGRGEAICIRRPGDGSICRRSAAVCAAVLVDRGRAAANERTDKIDFVLSWHGSKRTPIG